MADYNSPQAILADKENYYESVTRMVRWLAILIVLITYSPNWPYYNYLIAAAAIAAIFNAMRYSAGLMRRRLFASRVTTLVVDNLLIAILLGLSGGLSSPYFLFWIFTIISSAYWYGRRGIITVLSWEILVTLGLMKLRVVDIQVDQLRLLISEAFGLIALAVLAERLTHADRNERAILRLANREVEIQRQRMVALINSLADPVLAIDQSHLVTVYNGAALDLLNTNQQLSGQPLSQYLRLEDGQGKPVAIEQVLDHPSVLKRNDLVMQSSDGSMVNLDISVAPVHAPDGGDSGHILLLRDITKQKTLDQERDEFVAVTSHELRTPVAIVEANLSTVLLPKFDIIGKKARSMVQQAHQNIVFLGQLIKDLSTLSKAEQGLLKIEVQHVDPAALVQQLISDYGAQASAKNLQLTSKVSRKASSINTSLNLVHEILQNFLTNSLKYTQEGTITVAAEPDQHGEGVVFSVSDTGIGIAASDKKKLFTKFYRSEDYRTRKTSGTGLGLYITLKLAERLGAKIWYKSRLNAGSTFYLWVPPYDTKTPATLVNE